MKRIRTYGDNLVPLCERCWIEENSLWEADGVDINGNIITHLISVTVPIELSPGTVSDCYSCGKLTVVGIYISSSELDDDDDIDMLNEENSPEEPRPDEL